MGFLGATRLVHFITSGSDDIRRFSRRSCWSQNYYSVGAALIVKTFITVQG